MSMDLTLEHKNRVRIALAEAFVDSWVDYAYMAEQVRPYDLKIVEDILYMEVAPVCFWNLEAAVPPIWTGFEDESLLSEIEKALSARETSPVQRIIDRLKIAWLRYSYGYIWKEILKNL
ncbi:DUF7079 family protein [Pseudomonas nunensis]|uniref:DUF7079 domain-containing protein n=1 Tax=Pseudomonas nunensis TaxID=2961896 RepID=A0ABY5E7Y1_9PSED|nr:hypothetical protein [Pseudomonas nunensis]KOX98900.1 hypothetical protein AM274_28430 [Pseudomonas nunensis]KPN91682.1 hypothetical protein AL066_15610 [Pseudomonas nunensis]MCL5229622.1 hypothetical protein [Pseudomonas nunensis]UTO11886.1 hypothetical protein NK667_17035 [Pseudomonas nunensis]